MLRQLLQPVRRNLRWVSSEALTKPLTVSEFRKFKLENLEHVESFNENNLQPLIADFLVKPAKPDLEMAASLLNKFLFTVPGLDPEAELSNLFVLQLTEAGKSSEAVEFFKRLLDNLKNDRSKVKTLISQFMLEAVWENIFELHDDRSGNQLLELCNSNINIIESCGFSMDMAFKERLILELFLPRLNWDSIKEIVKQSSKQTSISISADTLVEIFRVCLNSESSDPYHDHELFNEHLVKPRFHRIIELLKDWKSVGIPVTGPQMARALSSCFHRFLPSEAMLQELESL